VKSAYTSGPWHVERPYTGTNRYPISCDRPDGARNILAEVNGQGGSGDAITANARLIAAAPDLLAACYAALNRFNDLAAAGYGSAPEERRLRAAIARATGGDQ